MQLYVKLAKRKRSENLNFYYHSSNEKFPNDVLPLASRVGFTRSKRSSDIYRPSVSRWRDRALRNRLSFYLSLDLGRPRKSAFKTTHDGGGPAGVYAPNNIPRELAIAVNERAVSPRDLVRRHVIAASRRVASPVFPGLERDLAYSKLGRVRDSSEPLASTVHPAMN